MNTQDLRKKIETMGAGAAFASDNTAGMCPEAWQALEQANQGFVPAYGDGLYTTRAADLFRELFETDCDVYFVFTGTAGNSLALSALCRSYHSVITHQKAHIETDECGAPEFFSNGTKILLVPGENGKLDLAEVEKTITRRRDIHYPKPRVISLTNATELGTVYTPEEMNAVCELARKHQLRVHVDGARFANAAASLHVHPAELTWKAGVDVLCFGGTKLGMHGTEAVIFFNRELAKEFGYRCKQAGQLASKMRFLSAPWIPLLQDNLWLKYARQANASARLLAGELEKIHGARLLYPVEANAVFVELPQAVKERLREKGWQFYEFIGGGGCRFMCSWQTQESDIQALVGDV